jgi:hypothetical protein
VAGSGEVLFEVDGGVAIVTLNAPDRRNVLTPAMADELIATFDEVDAKPEVGALVVRAVGKSFCAGGDIATLTSAGKDPAAPEAYEGMGKIYDSFYRLGQVRVPHGGSRTRLCRRGRHEHAAGGGPADRGEGRPAAVRLSEAGDAPGRRALRDSVQADRA